MHLRPLVSVPLMEERFQEKVQRAGEGIALTELGRLSEQLELRNTRGSIGATSPAGSGDGAEPVAPARLMSASRSVLERAYV